MRLILFQSGQWPVLLCSETANVWVRVKWTSLSCSFILSCASLLVSPMQMLWNSLKGLIYGTTPSYSLPGVTEPLANFRSVVSSDFFQFYLDSIFQTFKSFTKLPVRYRERKPELTHFLVKYGSEVCCSYVNWTNTYT